MAITDESQLKGEDLVKVPKYSPARPYPVLNPKVSGIIIVLDESEPIPPCTFYECTPRFPQAWEMSGATQVDTSRFRITTFGEFRVTTSGEQRIVL
jgi:hypothetical protein